MGNEYKLVLDKLIKYVNKINDIVSVMESHEFQTKLDNIIVLILMHKIQHCDINENDELINKYNINSNEDKKKLKNDFINDDDKIKYIDVLNYFIKNEKFFKLHGIKEYLKNIDESKIINYSNIITDSDDFLNALYANKTIDINDLKDDFVLDNVNKIFKNLNSIDSIKLFLYTYIIQNINNDGLNLDSNDYESIHLDSDYDTLDRLIDLIDNIYKEISKKNYTIDQFNNYIDQFNMNLNKYKIIEVENTHINNNVINYKCLYDGKLRKNNDIEQKNYRLIKEAFKNNINKNNIDLYFQYIKKRYEYKTNKNIELIKLEEVIDDSDIYENNTENNIKDNEEMAKKKKIKVKNEQINDSNKNKINPKIQNDEESKVEINNEIGNSQNIEDKIDKQLKILANKNEEKFNELVDEAGAEQWVKITDYSNFEKIKEVSPTSYQNFISNIAKDQNLLNKLNELVQEEPVEQKIDNKSKEQLTNETKNLSIENTEIISKMEDINNILENLYKNNKNLFYLTKNNVLYSIDEKDSFTLKEKIDELNDTLKNIFNINNRAQSDNQVYLTKYNLISFFSNPKELITLEKKFKTDFENNEYDLNILENQLIYVYLLMDLIEANNKLDNESSKETTNNKSDINDDSYTNSNSSLTQVEELVNDKTENKESENKFEEEKSEEQVEELPEQKDVKEEQPTTEKDNENKEEKTIDSHIDKNSNLYKLISFNNDESNYWSTTFNEHYISIKKKLLYLIKVFSSSIKHEQKDDKLNQLMNIISNKQVNYTNNKENYLDNLNSKITSFDTYFENIIDEIKNNQNLKNITNNILEDGTNIDTSELEIMKKDAQIDNENIKNYFIKLIEFTINFQNCINELNSIINQLYNFLKL